jgi:hypothetical protein
LKVATSRLLALWALRTCVSKMLVTLVAVSLARASPAFSMGLEMASPTPLPVPVMKLSMERGMAMVARRMSTVAAMSHLASVIQGLEGLSVMA